MAKGPVSAEMRGDTQVEFSRPQGQPEQKSKKTDGLGVSGALSALNKDKPRIKDRTDLKNLAAGRKKYRRFNTTDDYRESKFGVKKGKGNSPDNTEIHGTPAEGLDLDPRYLNIREELKQKWLMEHPGEDFLTEAGQNYNLGYLDRSQRDKPTLKSDSERVFRERYPDDATAYDIKEKTRVYEDPRLDPAVKLTEDDIIVATNNEVKDRSFGFDITWQRANRSQSMRGWRAFAERYPEKAAAYAEKHPGIKEALEEIRRQEQVQQQTQTGALIQAENDQLLADSVRVSENNLAENQVQTAEQPGENNTPDVITTEVNADAETKLLSAETAGAQAILLLGGEISTGIDKAKIEAIAEGGPIDTEKANKVSLDERKEYWRGDNSPFKDMTFEQQLERWKGKMQEFFDQYKGKPEAEFLQRMGIDVDSASAVAEAQKTYFIDGKGDVGLLAQTVAQNNTAEQIQENRALIEKLGKMHGEKSAKVIVEMAIGIKNAQTDIDTFIRTAQAAIDKGDDMPGADLIKFVNAKKEEQTETVEEAAPDVNNDREFKLNWDKRSASADTWTDGGGDLKVDGDVLSFTPNVNRLRNPYNPGTTEYDYFEKYQVRYFKPDQPSDFFIGEQRKRVERGVELAVNTGTDGEPKMVLTPMFWEIIEANPESVSGRWNDRYITLDQGENSVRSVRPVDLKIRNDEGTPRTVDVNFAWRGLKVDSQTLAEMQEKAVEYLEQQVASGKMPAETLDTAKALVSRYKAPRTVVRPREIPMLSRFRGPEKWRSNGSLAVHGHDIVYTTDELRKYRANRSIQITTADPVNPSRRILTAQAWDILDASSNGVDSNKSVTDSLTEPVMRRGGEWYRPVASFTADRPMLGRMRDLIRGSVSEAIAEGAMDSDVIRNVDTVLNYKSQNTENSVAQKEAA